MFTFCKGIASRRSAGIATGAICLLFALAPVITAQATIRPLSDFLSKQVVGSTGSPFIYWTDPTTKRAMVIDFAGKVNDYIVAHGGTSAGTTVSGTIMERPLKNGTAEVTVQLHLDNAIVWGYAPEGTTTPLVFGHVPSQILTGADAALGTVNLTLKFTISKPGAPLADLSTIVFGWKTEVFQQLNSIAQGTFRAAYGVADGTAGIAQTTQTGNYQSQGNGGPRGDYFPAEHIDYHVQ